MRLGIDITPLQVVSPGGIGVATYHTVRELAKQDGLDIVLYGRSAPVVPFSGEPLDLGLELRSGSGPLAAAGNIAWLQHGVAPILRKDRIDVFWGTRNVLPRRAPRVARVATLYDFWHVRHPEQQPLLNRTLNRSVIEAAVRDADVLTAISDTTAGEARDLFPDAASKVRTVHLGVDPAEFFPADESEVARVRTELGVEGRFVLAIDVHNARKNFPLLLEAAARIAGSAPEFRIVAVGEARATARDSGVAEHAQRLGLSSRVTYAGDLAPSDLRALYTGCAAFVYPSVYEGFGMPVLEAMSCGAPVLCSSTSSLPEVAGDSALLFDPSSADELASVLARVLSDPAETERLRVAGRWHAASFSWERTAAGMRAAFEDALAARRAG